MGLAAASPVSVQLSASAGLGLAAPRKGALLGSSAESPPPRLCVRLPSRAPPCSPSCPFLGRNPPIYHCGLQFPPRGSGTAFPGGSSLLLQLYFFFCFLLLLLGVIFVLFFFFLFPLLPPLLAPVTSPALSGAAELGAVPGLLSPGAACGGNGPFLPPQIGFPARQALTASSCSPLPIRAALTHFGGVIPGEKKPPLVRCGASAEVLPSLTYRGWWWWVWGHPRLAPCSVSPGCCWSAVPGLLQPMNKQEARCSQHCPSLCTPFFKIF